jgi:hypothetical protein
MFYLHTVLIYEFLSKAFAHPIDYPKAFWSTFVMESLSVYVWNCGEVPVFGCVPLTLGKENFRSVPFLL